MKTNVYGDAAIKLNLNNINCGDPVELHQIFDYAIEHGARPLKIDHPLNVHQRVLNGLDRDDRFKKYYTTYPGIYKRPVRSFVLKEGD